MHGTAIAPRTPTFQAQPHEWKLTWASFFTWSCWLLFVGLTGWGIIANGIILIGPIGDVNPLALHSASGLFALDLWGFCAAAFMVLIVDNTLYWQNGTRFALGGLALAMMLGRVAGGGVAGMMLSYADPPLWVTLPLAPFALVLAGVLTIAGLGVIAGALFSFFVAIPMMIFNQILSFENALHIYRYQTKGLASYIVRFMMWLRNERRAAPAPDDSRGARFATFNEIRQLQAPDAANAMTFGHVSGLPLAIYTDKHILIMASTRSGKGVTLIIPYLLRYAGSAFVLDPKGENARATGRQRALLNDRVHYLDPFGISGKPQSRFNPLTRFTPENMEAESKSLAAALFVVTDKDRDHWTAAGQQLLAFVILYVYASPGIAEDKKDLPTVRKLLLSGLDLVLKEMATSALANGLLADLANSFIKTPEKELGSIVSTAQRQTEILDNPYIIECLSATGKGSEVDFKDWHKGTMTVYLCLSAPKFPVFNRWLRLVLTSALDEMTDTLNPPALPVCFMLDELATLGHLGAVENAVGLAAGYGIQLVTVFQDTAQMRDLYKGRWASFIGNAGVRALFNLDDYDTAEYWSKSIGGTLIETHSRQEDMYGLSSGQNVGETMRPLLSTDKLMMDFASHRMLVLAQGAHPIVSERVPYWKDSTLADLWDDPRKPTMPPPPLKGVAMPPPPKAAKPAKVSRSARATT